MYVPPSYTTPVTITLSGNHFCTANDVHQVGWGTNNATISDTGSTYYKQSPNVLTLDIFNGNTAAMTINSDTFDEAITWLQPYDIVGSGSTFAGGTTSGTANSYKENTDPGDYRFTWNGTTYDTVAAWLAAISPQDSAATTTRSGASACALPTIPSVN